MPQASKDTVKPTVDERDISCTTPQRWRLPFLIALIVVGAMSFTWVGLVELTFVPRFAEPNKHDANVKWGEEFSLFGNMYDWFTSLRGEWMVGLIFSVFFLCFIVHGIFWLFFKAIMDPEIYKKLPYREAWFLGQKSVYSVNNIKNIVNVYLFYIILEYQVQFME